MTCPHKSPECKRGKKCADCRSLEKIIKRGKCVDCKKPTSKETLKWNGGTCEPCTDEEMAEAEAKLGPTLGEQIWGENWTENIALTQEEREVLSQRGKL